MLTKFSDMELADANSVLLKTEQRKEEVIMPLTLAAIGEENIIKKIGGKPEVRKHLEDLGFVAGGSVKVINTLGGNVIVNVKESRIAISREMAQKIMI